uniref:capsule biosynthesis protein n=1 Tax=uncultured Halomonas sp. TaxID=173971 RepID=UPI00262E8A4C|nr:capsular biosynthesis protein [uncultured Halomonas sp.]
MHDKARSFLLLQGPSTPFFQRLAERLGERGHRVHVVNFNGGDCLYRRGLRHHKASHHDFRGHPEQLPAFLSALYRRHAITDQVMFGDRRPVHRPALAEARRQGVRNHVFEEGYLRPHWITLEREGVNGHSPMPRDPDWYHRAAAALARPARVRGFRTRFRVRAMHDVAYHLAGLANPLAFPGYRNHAPITAPREYAGYVRRFTRLRLTRRRRRDSQCIRRLVAGPAPYFVLALQLNGDAQIRDHSPFKDMRQVIETALRSFAAHAAPEARLVIKNHPLDMGLVDYAALIRALEAELGLAGRLEYLESGDLNVLLDKAAGMVTVNSTSGLVALEHGCPTLALSDPIYALPGLTFDGPLERFWMTPSRPDAALFQALRTTLLHCTQLNGGFYCRTGIELAVANAVPRLEADHSPLEALLSCLPRAA